MTGSKRIGGTVGALPGTPVKQAVLMLLYFVLLSSCHSDGSLYGGNAGTGVRPRSLRASGSVYMAGRPSVNQEMEVRIQAATSDGCWYGTPQRAYSSDATGHYEVEVDDQDFTSASSDSCPPLDVANVLPSDVVLIAAIPVSRETCQTFCEPGESVQDCVARCSTDFSEITAQPTHVGTAGGWDAFDIVFDQLGTTLNSQPLPDLVVDRQAAAKSIEIQTVDLSPSSCAVVEGCVKQAGERRLLRFDSSLRNQGSKSAFVGSPVGNPDYTYSPCHGHYHGNEIAHYEIIDPVTKKPVTDEGGSTFARKQGFCFMDSQKFQDTNEAKTYTCDNQGLSPGWADYYAGSLDCQWLDITGLKSGSYTLRITANPGKMFEESERTNNAVEIPVTVP